MNTFIIDGRLTADPELSHTNSGKTVSNFSVANNTGYGEVKKTNFFNCIAWGKTAELIQKFANKGMEVIIEGELNIEQWEGKDGVKKSSPKLTVLKIKFIFKDKKEPSNDNNMFEDSSIPF
jgi:single-strand DNA-binding protein